jgi:hypothetical protein
LTKVFFVLFAFLDVVLEGEVMKDASSDMDAVQLLFGLIEKLKCLPLIFLFHEGGVVHL